MCQCWEYWRLNGSWKKCRWFVEGINRPALMAELPNPREVILLMLDLGANLSVQAIYCLILPIWGMFMRETFYRSNPHVLALLNVGQEAHKGCATLQAAATQLQASQLNYQGFIEGDRFLRVQMSLYIMVLWVMLR